jgi:hypothetical protein
MISWRQGCTVREHTEEGTIPVVATGPTTLESLHSDFDFSPSEKMLLKEWAEYYSHITILIDYPYKLSSFPEVKLFAFLCR